LGFRTAGAVEYHRPKVVFQPGLGWLADAVKYYNLRHRATIPHARKSGRLLEHYELPDGTPWLATPHWTSSFGFSKEDESTIKSYATNIAGMT
jgi:hypothetical protein